MKVLFAESRFWNTHPELQEEYKKEVATTFREVRKLLPSIHKSITFVVQVNKHETMPEYGTGGATRNSELILLFLDSKLPYGERGLLANTREIVFHELNHAARYAIPIWHKSFLDSCLMEGLATVFERDRAGSKPLYGIYDLSEVTDWLRELQEGNPESRWQEYMFRHGDGRRWIGYKVGTYLIDEALQRSGKSIEALTLMECQDILKAAQF
ncbi:MAG TPA: DUF2268 domain-containing putative Zn-dependent protease [Candidatus Saccharimonadales bacterium]|nr:DUF2268 domain-containing putative Zn-dependent protease [Candidatus Saccharimonadales bacterium]